MTTHRHPATMLAEAREKDGRSYDKILRAVTQELGDVVPVTKQTIANYHNPDKLPEKPDLFILMAIANAYGLTLSQIGVDVPESLRDLVFRASRCNGRTPAEALV